MNDDLHDFEQFMKRHLPAPSTPFAEASDFDRAREFAGYLRENYVGCG